VGRAWDRSPATDGSHEDTYLSSWSAASTHPHAGGKGRGYSHSLAADGYPHLDPSAGCYSRAYPRTICYDNSTIGCFSYWHARFICTDGCLGFRRCA